MELLYELESQADEFIVERMRRAIADALSGYNPMCDVAMGRHHSRGELPKTPSAKPKPDALSRPRRRP